MKSNDKSIKKRDLDWLWSAISVNDAQRISIGNDAAIAADGIRAHIINAKELPDNISGISSSTVDNLLKIEESVSFWINPKYLMDALRGFVPSENGTVEIKITGNAEDRNQRIIIDDDTDNIAVIMCCKGEK